MSAAAPGAAPAGAELGARLAEWLRARDPQAGAIDVEGLQAASAGYSNVTLLGRIRRAPVGTGTREVVLRLQPGGDSIFPDHDVTRQYRVLEALAGAGLPVPAPLGLEPRAAVLGAPFFLMERIEGRVPNENPLYHLEGWFHDLPAAGSRSLWLQGIGMVGRLSRLDWQGLGLGFLAPPPGVTPLARQLAYYADAVRWAERLAGRDYPLLHAAHRWLAAHAPASEPVAFSWGDAKLGNCVFHDGRLAGVLDFEQATLANPVDDLAWWLMLDESLSDGYGVPRLASLPSRAESIAAWEQASGREARDLGYYEVCAAWRMAFIMTRIADLFRRRGLVPADSDMDVNNGAITLLRRHGRRLGFLQE